MRSPKWVTAQELDRWAATPQAKVVLPNLIRRLVFATVASEHLKKADFPAGAETQRPGYDGITLTDQGTPFVPDGLTFWELGCVVDNPKRKAQEDYDTRLAEHEERVAKGVVENLKEASYIAVTAVDWQRGKDWEKDRNKDGHFREVRAYDSNTLEHWIEIAPGVGLWLAREMGKKVDGVVDVGSHWANVQAALRQPLPPYVLLVNRQAISTAFENWVEGDGQTLAVKAASAAELVAVFCAWVQTLPVVKRDAILSRSIIVESRDTWRELATTKQSLILIPAPQLDGDADLFAEASRQGHRVLKFADFRAARNESIELPMMRRFDLQQALQVAGIPDVEAHQLAEAAGGNFTILRRRFARNPDIAPWAQDSVLASLLLVPAWHDECSGDQRIVSQIAGKDYADIQAIMMKRRSEPDPPVRRVLETWEFLSPVDAWEALHPLLTPSHIERFQTAAIEVLTEDDPALELPPDERFMAAVKGKVRQFSEPLRRGIAEMLALGATREQESGVGNQLKFAARAAVIVSNVLPAGCSWQRWASLNGLLPLLMEAAPEAMITTVERDLASENPQLGNLLKQETPGPLTGRIYHSGTLWSLETAAWSAERLQRVSLALARFAKLDAGESKWSNRPRSSLLSLFFSWRPQTLATLRQRVDALEYLRRKEPGETWRLLLNLLPKVHESITDNPKPTYRSWAAGWNGETTVSDYKALITGASKMAVDMTEEDMERWPALAEHLGELREENLETALLGLNKLATKDIPPNLKQSLWTKLREIVRDHTRFTSARWALPEAEVQKLSALRDKFAPADPLIITGPLFDDDGWLDGDESEPLEGKIARREAERRVGIRQTWKTGGTKMVLELAKRVRQPWSVGWSLGQELGAEAETEIVPKYLADEEEAIWKCAAAFGRQRIQTGGLDWAEARPSERWTPEQVAAWAMEMPFSPRTWDWVAGRGDLIKKLYWERTQTRSLPALDLPARARAARELQAVERSWSALDLLMMAKYEKCPLSPDVVCEALESIARTPKEREPGSMDAHYVQEAFQFLQAASGADQARVARLEFDFLPFLDGHPVLPLTLQQELSKQPGFFVACLELLYKRQHRAKEDEAIGSSEKTDPEKAAKASRIWRLLRKWRVIPGTSPDGSVSLDQLRSWVTAARDKAREIDRLEVCDETLGELFAKSPVGEDNGLPVVPVREIIEECESEDLERGFVIGLRNLRGVISKALYEGGKQERVLAETFERHAQICANWPRTAAAHSIVSRSYQEEAEREDERAKLRD